MPGCQKTLPATARAILELQDSIAESRKALSDQAAAEVDQEQLDIAHNNWRHPSVTPYLQSTQV